MKFWEVRNMTSTSGELALYGEFSEVDNSWWDGGQYITSAKFLEDLEPLKNKSEITVRINSAGGNFFVALQIANRLKELGAKKKCIIEGMAASAATIVSGVCDEVLTYDNGLFMVHKPKLMVDDFCDDTDLQKHAELLRACKESIINTYMAKTGKTYEEIESFVDEERWFVGQEAVDAGFCDGIMGKNLDIEVTNSKFIVVNSIAHNLNSFGEYGALQSRISAVSNKKMKTEGEKKVMDLAKFKTEHPDIYNQVMESAREEERTRIREIDEISASIKPEMVLSAKYEKPVSAKDLCFNAMKENSLLAGAYMSDLKDDNGTSGVGTVLGGGEPESGSKKTEIKNYFVNAMNKDKRRAK